MYLDNATADELLIFDNVLKPSMPWTSFFGCAALALASSGTGFVDTGHGGCSFWAPGPVRGFEAGCATLLALLNALYNAVEEVGITKLNTSDSSD